MLPLPGMKTSNRSLMNRMRVVSPRMHAPVDYVLVGAFALAPSVLGLGQVASIVSWVLAAGYLGLSMFTAYPLGMAKVIPFPTHGKIEMVLGPALIALPFLAGFGDVATTFFAVAGLAISGAALTTDYRAAETDSHQRYLNDRPRHGGIHPTT